MPAWVWAHRNGVPIAQAATASAEPATRLEGEWVWGGWAVHQPGHFVAEHATRLLFAARERPDDHFLFLLRKGGDAGALPAWFWDVLAWLGVARERVSFVTDAPVVVERLTVFPQAEHLTGLQDDQPGPRDLDPTGLPSAEYLAGLAENFESKNLAVPASGVVYVSRAGLPVKIGGEAYLEQVLRAAGVTVIKPETLSIAEQMQAFAGAQHLVFAEGSALHFRQLIGYLPQKITVLQRRPGRMVARGALTGRCDSLEYAEVVRGLVCGPFHPDSGVPFGHVAFGLADPAKLLSAFAAIGVDLTQGWTAPDYDAAVRADLLEWARYIRALSTKNALRYALNALVSLTALGEPADVAELVAHEIEPSGGIARIQDVARFDAERDRMTARIAGLEAQLSAIRRSPALRLGRALVAPAVQAQRWYERVAHARSR